MKIAVIGDVHGRKIWLDIVNDAMKKVDKIVFLGDYVDPYSEKIASFSEYDAYTDKQKNDILNSTDDEELKSFMKYLSTPKYKYPSYFETSNILKNIIKFKKEHKDSVILIIGNHDAHYLYDEIEPCTRYDFKNASKLKKIYKENKDLFQYAYQYKNNLFTHAGVTNKWFYYFYNFLVNAGLEKFNLAQTINNMGKNKLYNKALNTTSKYRGGDDNVSGPLWSDINESYNDYLDGYNQYVGHSMVNYIATERNKNGSITYCDVLENPKKNISSNYKIINV